MHFLIASIILSVCFALYKKAGWSCTMLVVAFTNAYVILPVYLNQSSNIDDPKRKTLTLLHSNVLSSNLQHEKLIELIEKEQPDIIVTQEVNEQWTTSLSKLHMAYPYQLIHPREDNFGIALYSKTPLLNAQIIRIGMAKLPSIKASFVFNNEVITLVASHSLPPVNQQYLVSRNEHILALATLLNSIQTPKILVGDLNTTPWSSFYHPLTANSNMINTRQGFGIIATWPAALGPLGIPIDHVLISNEFKVVSMDVAKSIGSDHLPLIVSVSLNSEN